MTVNGNRIEEWRTYVTQRVEFGSDSDHQETITWSESLVNTIAEALAHIYEQDDQRKVQAYMEAQWAILARLIHFSEFLESLVPEESMQILHGQRSLLTVIFKMAEQSFEERYGQPVTLPQVVERSPGFLRYLREECGLEFVMHYIGFSLQTFLGETLNDREKAMVDQAFFEETLSYLLQVIVDFETPHEIADTLRKQQDELTWLTEEIQLKQAELAQEPDNERFQEELQILQLDFMTEKLEHDYLQQLIEPIF